MLNLDWSIIWNIVNILVLFLLLKHFLFGPITKMMESRTAEIENNLKDAEEKNRKAEALGAEYEKQLADAQAEAAKLVQEAKERGQKEYDEILKNADQDARTAAARAHTQLELDREQMLRQVQGNMTELVLAAASKLSQKEMDGEADRRLVDSLLSEVGEKP